MLQELYGKYSHGLSKSDHKLFSYLLEHQQEIPVITTEELSEKLSVSRATISRFWSKIGFRNLKEFQKFVFGHQEATPYSRISASLSRWEAEGISPDSLTEHVTACMQQSFSVTSPEHFDLAAGMLLSARNIYVYAPDSSQGLECVIRYRLQRLGIRILHLPSGSQIYDAMVNLGSDDLVILFGYSRILAEEKILLAHSRIAGFRTILFTDLMAAPELDQAGLVLYCSRGEKNGYHSMAVPMILTDLLIMTVYQKAGNSRERAKELEALRERYRSLIRR